MLTGPMAEAGATAAVPPRRWATLQELIEIAVDRHADRVCLVDGDGTALTYRDMWVRSEQVRGVLVGSGVRRGDRVGLMLPKSADAVAAIWGILRAGAAYVPVDPASPMDRAAYTLNDCGVRAVLVAKRLHGEVGAALEACGSTPAFLTIDDPGALAGVSRGTTVDGSSGVEPDDLAYILYTSGSTGRPKGVMLSHRNAVSFVRWCVAAFEPRADDRFSSHAPFHFDLSILDLYTPLDGGAAIVLVPADVGREPMRLAEFIADARITVWYSAPSILSMLVQYGHMERHDYGQLRTVLFAGEVFPVKYLRELTERLPGRRYCNLYGPTETNVCTWHEVQTPIPPDRTEPYPIGRVCPHSRALVVDEGDRPVEAGVEGELCIAGSTVTRGYWNLPERTASAFLSTPDGTVWYRTGDIVVLDSGGDYLFVGRRDRMVKRRGYRIELGEIEAGLYKHPDVREAAAIAVKDPDGGVRIVAHIAWQGRARPSVLAMKSFSASALPAWMSPDAFIFRDELPKTSTDKIDYQRLALETGA